MAEPVLDDVFRNVYNKYANPTTMSHDELRAKINSVEYFEDGNFTTCVVYLDLGVVAGASKRHHEDKRLPIRGRSVALVRALQMLLRRFDAK